MDKKYAIFDLDGTLVSSMEYWSNIVNEYINLNASNYKFDVDIMRKDNIYTMTLEELTKYLVEVIKVPFTVDEMLQGFDNLMKNHYKNDILLKDGVVDYLDKLYNNNVKMCVASSTKKNLIEFCLKNKNINKYFDFVISCRDVGKGKSNPLIYNTCAEKFSAKNNDIAVFEDSYVAMTTAKNAGFYVVGVYDKLSSDRIKDSKHLADEFIESFKNFN